MSNQSTLNEFAVSDTSNQVTGSDSSDKKLYRNEEWLQEQYWEQEKILREIADEVGVSQKTITNWMDKHEIERRSNSKAHTDGDIEPLKNEQWLREQYWEQEKTTYEIADEVGVSQKTITNWMDKHEIERRSITEIQTDGDLKRLKNEEWLREQYCEQEKTTYEIADEVGLAQGTVRTWMQKHGIDRRSTAESLTNGDLERLKNEEWLREQYCEQEKTTYEIADELGLSKTTVLKWMREHGIERRGRSEARTNGDLERLKNEEWLREQYCERQRTVREIANELNLSPSPVQTLMQKHGIERRLPAESQTDGDLELIKNEEWLREQYWEQEKTLREIADKAGVSQKTIRNWMDKHEIDRRTLSESHTDGDVESLKNEEWLREQYCERQRTVREIANELDLSQTTVRKWLDIHDIELRSLYMYPEYLPHPVIGELELDVANCLHDGEINYKYESLEIECGDNHIYIPDFVTENYIIECKGAEWGKIHNNEVTAEQKAEAAMRHLDKREYVVVGIELPCDIHIPWEERATIQELFE